MVVLKQGFYQKQRGQGMVGFIVATVFFLVPSILAVNYLARVGDARHKSHEAARYATWERTIWQASGGGYHRKTDASLSREALVRVFGEQQAILNSVKDRDVNEKNDPKLDPNLYVWQKQKTERLALLQPGTGNNDPTLVRVQTRNNSPSSSAASVLDDVAGTLLKLNKKGFISSSVSIDLASADVVREQLKSEKNPEGRLALTSNNAMLAEPWAGAGPKAIRATVKRTLPTGFLDNSVMDILSTAAATIGFKEFKRLDFGHIDTEQVPCQRLVRKNSKPLC